MRPTHRAPLAWTGSGRAGGTAASQRARFEQFAWLEVGSVKMALSHTAHQRVPFTPLPGRFAGVLRKRQPRGTFQIIFEKALFHTTKISLLTLVGLFLLSACAQVASPIPSSVTVESPTLTKNVDVHTPVPSRTPSPSQTLNPTPTEWLKVYPTKKALLIYSTSFRSEYTLHFIEWGDFYPTPYLILYEDGQLIFGIGAFEKQLSQADTQAIVSKLEQLGFPQLQKAYDANPESVFTDPPDDTSYSPQSSTIEITLDKNGPITYQKYLEEYLSQPMKEIISYLDSFSSEGATPYQPERLLVAAGDATEIPEGETVIPWPEGVTSPSHRSYMGVFYLEGNEALKLYQAAGEYLFGYFSYEGKNYEIHLRPILPHECHIYHLYEETPPAQPYFTCDDW